MEGIIVGVITAFVVHGGLMWYKIGKLEQKLADLCREVRETNKRKEGT